MKNVIYIYVYHLTYTYIYISFSLNSPIKEKIPRKKNLAPYSNEFVEFFSYLGNYSFFLRKCESDVIFYLE